MQESEEHRQKQSENTQRQNSYRHGWAKHINTQHNTVIVAQSEKVGIWRQESLSLGWQWAKHRVCSQLPP